MNSDLSPTPTGPSCHDVAELVQADVPALAVSTCIDHFLGPPTSGTGVLRRGGVGWNHAVLAERPASAIPAGSSLAFGISRDQLPHLCQRARRLLRNLVLLTGRGACGCRRGRAHRLRVAVCLVTHAGAGNGAAGTIQKPSSLARPDSEYPD